MNARDWGLEALAVCIGAEALFSLTAATRDEPTRLGWCCSELGYDNPSEDRAYRFDVNVREDMDLLAGLS